MVSAFQFSVPQDVLFGKGSLEKLPEILEKLGSQKLLIISGRHLNKMGTVSRVAEMVAAKNIGYVTYTDVAPNPTVQMVEEAAELYRQSGASSILALGGGSPMDVAKAVAVVVTYGGSITEYEGSETVPGPTVPVIAIPTTAGTGSEVTAASVITDTDRNYKLTVFSRRLIPSYAILDPELLSTMPFSVATSTGIDAMIHALEAYISRAATPFTDAMAEKALELIGPNLRRFAANRQDEDAAAAMLLGSMFAGLSFTWARTGNVHAMSHPVSAYFHVSHGLANAILLPVILEFNQLADHGRYEKIYNYIKKVPSPAQNFTPDLLVHEVRNLLNDLSIPQHLAEVGVKEELIEQMAADAMKSGNIAVNPRQTTVEDVIALYRKAM